MFDSVAEVAGITYADLTSRLTPDALGLFREMVSAHLESSGDRLFIRADSMSGTHMIFAAEGSKRRLDRFDGGALVDLVRYGLLHQDFSSRGTPNYRVSGEGLHFHKWLLEREGSPVAEVEAEVNRLLNSEEFVRRHPDGSRHLHEAFSLLWEGSTDKQTVSEIGDHLRKAIMDVTTVVVGDDQLKQEQPIERLEVWLNASQLGDRERAVATAIVDLARASLHLDHRLNHVRDEVDKKEPPVGWEEMRRAAFATAVACYEISRIAERA